MELSESEKSVLGDIWADDKRREIAKRTIAIAMSRLTIGVPVQYLSQLSDQLDDMLLPQKEAKPIKDHSL